MSCIGSLLYFTHFIFDFVSLGWGIWFGSGFEGWIFFVWEAIWIFFACYFILGLVL